MYCKNCGKEIDDNAIACPNCGAATDNFTKAKDSRNGGFAFLCFLFPIVGLILYLIWHDEYPQKAKSCAKGAIIGVIVYVVSIIIYCIIIGITVSSVLYANVFNFNGNMLSILNL